MKNFFHLFSEKNEYILATKKEVEEKVAETFFNKRVTPLPRYFSQSRLTRHETVRILSEFGIQDFSLTMTVRLPPVLQPNALMKRCASIIHFELASFIICILPNPNTDAPSRLFFRSN